MKFLKKWRLERRLKALAAELDQLDDTERQVTERKGLVINAMIRTRHALLDCEVKSRTEGRTWTVTHAVEGATMKKGDTFTVGPYHPAVRPAIIVNCPVDINVRNCTWNDTNPVASGPVDIDTRNQS
jgi:hypothetical protein